MMKTAAKNECAVWVRGLQYTGAAIVSGLFMSPAIILNLLSLKSRGPEWAFMSVVLVAGGAWLLHDAWNNRKLLSGLLGIVVVAISMVTAVRNIGGLRQATDQTRNDAIKARDKVAENRDQLVTKRKAQAEIPGVGEIGADVFSAQIEKEKLNPMWTKSRECTDATAWGSQALCGRIADLNVKLKAAQARDGFQGQIDEIDHPSAQAPKVPLPTADNAAIIRMAGWFGFGGTKNDDVDQNYEIALVLVFELLAAAMPGIVFRTILGGPSAKVAEPEPVQEPEPEAQPHKSPSPDTPPRKPRTAPRIPKPEPVQGGATVINMDRSKVVQNQRSMDMLDRAKVVQDPRFKGMGQREIADQLGRGWSKSTVQRAQSYAKLVQSGPVNAVA